MPEATRAPRILLTADVLGGVFQYAVELATGLARAGSEVFVATMGGPLLPAQRRTLERAGRSIRIYESRFRLEWMDDPWAEVDAAGHWLLDLAARIDPDIVHLNGYCHAALPWRRPVVVVAHSCVLSWWRAVRREPGPASLHRYRDAVSKGLAAADVIVAPSRAMMDALRSEYQFEGPQSVIYNGRSAAEFAPAGKHPFIVGLGRVWDDAKNLQLLDEAARGLAWPVLIGGPRHPNGRGRQFHHARYAGPLGPAALRTFLSRAAIYALPARYEPFGLSVLEAALSGCALVLGAIPSLREIWGDAALYVDPDDVASLRQALVRLIRDRSLAAQMGEQARRVALDYSSERMVASYLALYGRLSHHSAATTSRGAACA